MKKGWKLPNRKRERIPVEKNAAPRYKRVETGRPGRPPIELDENVVMALAMRECTMAEIAAICGVSERTLSDKYRDVVARGRLQGNATLRKKQYDMAMAGNVTMLIWLGKNRLGQKDGLELSGPGGQPLQPPNFQLVFVNKFTGPDGKEKLLPLPQIEVNPFQDTKPPIDVPAEAAPAGD